MNRILVVLFLFIQLVVFAQSSEKYNSEYATFYRAEELYQKEQYGSAREEFRVFIDEFQRQNKNQNDPMLVKAKFYEGMSALILFNNDAVALLKDFLKNYPESIYKTTIYFELGNYYYHKRDYEEAIAYYNRISAVDVPEEERSEYYFKKGYANFQEEHFDEARSSFYEIKNDSSEYANSALYFFSHIEYTNKNYQTALDGFLALESNPSFSKVVPYYILQIYYLQKKYEKVTEYAPKLKDATVVNENDVNHLIGDAYYRVGKFDESVFYLEKFDKQAETTRDEDYQLAYSYYKIKRFNDAIQLFDRVVAGEKDSLAQVSLYHIGECYVAVNNKLSARSAFQKASEIELNPEIEEDALYHYAVLSYQIDVNPYSEAIRAFETYLNSYPNSERKSDIYQYLVNVYATTNNYNKALESLNRIENKDLAFQKVYQLIAYNYGVELYQKENYQGAIDAFELVEEYPINASLSAKSVFWSADAYYMLKKFRTAIADYKSYLSKIGANSTELRADAQYNVSYAYLYAGDTTSAIENFRSYVQFNPTNKHKLADAYLRLADCYFMQRENQIAINYYDKAIQLNVSGQDKALYYKSITLGVENLMQEKITTLSQLVNEYPSSKYVQKSLYELAFTYKLTKKYDDALNYFNRYLQKFPNSSEEALVRIEMADVYYKKSDYKKSENAYVEILQKFPNDGICNSVGEGLQHVFTATKEVDKLEHYAKQYPCLNINNLTLENLLYGPAETDFISKKYKEAIPKLNAYLSKYPTGYHAQKANFYLATSFYEIDSFSLAVTIYDEILHGEKSSYFETAAIRSAKYHYNQGEFEPAIFSYQKTQESSSDVEVLFNADLGLMRSYYQTQKYDSSAMFAQKVMSNSLLKQEHQLEANYINGKSNFEIGAYDQAISSLTFVSLNTTKAVASEAKFLIAQAYFNKENIEAADTHARGVLKMKPTYDYWIANALILQTKILMHQHDLFQAEQTILSVIEQYPVEDDGIKDEAQQVYSELMQLKNTPKTVETTDSTTVIEINEGNK